MWLCVCSVRRFNSPACVTDIRWFNHHISTWPSLRASRPTAQSPIHPFHSSIHPVSHGTPTTPRQSVYLSVYCIAGTVLRADLGSPSPHSSDQQHTHTCICSPAHGRDLDVCYSTYLARPAAGSGRAAPSGACRTCWATHAPRQPLLLLRLVLLAVVCPPRPSPHPLPDACHLAHPRCLCLGPAAAAAPAIAAHSTRCPARQTDRHTHLLCVCVVMFCTSAACVASSCWLNSSWSAWPARIRRNSSP